MYIYNSDNMYAYFHVYKIGDLGRHMIKDVLVGYNQYDDMIIRSRITMMCKALDLGKG